ncbi:DUF4362 domain-containing protein [Peribacillus sp. SCS-37]|uniref:DUF4362 domain-containing protein n=1 Tax=Paraperibacillus esterisolvens TaxID=3115296 RepID=UPI0039064AF5
MKKLVLAASLSLMLSGCTDNASKVKEDDVLVSLDRFDNISSLDRFYADVQDGKKGNIRVVRYTLEGDPIFHNINFDGKRIELTIDSREDRYGGGAVEKFSCKKAFHTESYTRMEYSLAGCDSGQTELELVTINYDIKAQDRFDFHFKYGKKLENEIDTNQESITAYIPRNDVKRTVSDFHLSEAELTVIYKNMVLANYLDRKGLTASCRPARKNYNLTVWINDAKLDYQWADCDRSKDGRAMTALAKKMITIIKNSYDYPR